MGLSERKKEITRRRKRHDQLARMKYKLPTLDEAGKARYAEKLRNMTLARSRSSPIGISKRSERSFANVCGLTRYQYGNP